MVQTFAGIPSLNHRMRKPSAVRLSVGGGGSRNSPERSTAKAGDADVPVKSSRIKGSTAERLLSTKSRSAEPTLPSRLMSKRLVMDTLALMFCRMSNASTEVTRALAAEFPVSPGALPK